MLDHDTYSAHDAIGKVYVDLNPLLTKDKPLFISGWFPIYDTMHGKLVFWFLIGILHMYKKILLFHSPHPWGRSNSELIDKD